MGQTASNSSERRTNLIANSNSSLQFPSSPNSSQELQSVPNSRENASTGDNFSSGNPGVMANEVHSSDDDGDYEDDDEDYEDEDYEDEVGNFETPTFDTDSKTINIDKTSINSNFNNVDNPPSPHNFSENCDLTQNQQLPLQQPEISEVSEPQSDASPFPNGGQNDQTGPNDDGSDDEYEDEDKEDEDEEYEAYPSNAFIPIEDRAISELQNLSIQEMEQFHPPSKLDTLLWRIGICLFCLAFVWVTSIQVLWAFISFAIPTPTTTQVIDRWGVTVDTTVSEVGFSTKCYNTGYQTCYNRMTTQLETFRASMQETFDIQNAASLASNTLITPCSNEYKSIISAFNTHREYGYPVIFDQTRCTAEQIDKTKLLVGYSDNVYASAIMKRMEKIGEDWAYRFSNVTESLQARFAYDKAYLKSKLGFIKVDLQGMLDELEILLKRTQLELDALSIPPLALNGVVPWNDILDLFNTPLHFINVYAGTFSDLWASAKAQWIDIQNAFEKVSLPNIIPDVNLAFPIRTVDFSAWSDTLSGGVDSLNVLIEAHVLQVQERARLEIDRVKENAEDLKALIQRVERELENRLNFPDFNLLDINLDMALQFDTQFESLSRAVDTISQWGSTAKAELKDEVGRIIDKIDLKPPEFASLSLPWLNKTYWRLLAEDADYKGILGMFATIFSVICVFDIIMRVASSVKIVFTFGKMTTSQLPRLDNRKNSNDHNRVVDFISKLPYGMLGPALTVVTIIVFIIMVVIYVLFSYIGMYGGYIKGCVSSKNSTFVGQNAFVIAYNFANDSSRVVGWQYEQRYVGEAWATCKNEVATMNEKVAKFNFRLGLDKKALVNNYDDLFLLQRCISPLTYTNINPVESNTGETKWGAWLQTHSAQLASTDGVHTILGTRSTPFILQPNFDEFEMDYCFDSNFDQNKIEQFQLLQNPDLDITTPTFSPQSTKYEQFSTHCRYYPAMVGPLDRLTHNKHQYLAKKHQNVFKKTKTTPIPLYSTSNTSTPLSALISTTFLTENTVFTPQDDDAKPYEPIYVDTNRVDIATNQFCATNQLRSYPWNGFEVNLPQPGQCTSYVSPECPIYDCLPSQASITASTHSSSCDSEWLFHSMMIKMLVLILTLVCTNVSRIFLVKFMIQYLFRRLGCITIEIIEFYRYKELKSTITGTERRTEVVNLIDSVQAKSMIWLFLSIIMHLPYLIVIFFVLDHMAPMR